MNLKDNILKLLIVILILVFLTDLIVHTWFSKKFHLLFESQTFNNVITPIFTIVSVVIYSVALFLTIAQNKIILSQNIKPFYEKEIEKLIDKAKNTKVDALFFDEEVNVLNYVSYINKTFIRLNQNPEYIEDLKRFRNNCSADFDYFKNRSYINEILFLSDFVMGIGPVYFFYEDLKQFIIEINESKLITEDRRLLKAQIKRIFLSEYMSIMNLRSITILPQIPLIFGSIDNKEIVYKRLPETEFGQHYSFFLSEL